MADASFHKVISVFLASPDDLKDERRLTREIVDRLNKSLRLYGQHIDLYGWEDIAPGAGRAQGKINPFVDRCDLFVGVLHRRWGTPTGEFSSGFHEEYSRVRKRYEDTGCPDIALFFKYADEVSLDDPGPQLKQILAFRDSVKSEVYFRDFRDVEEWKNYIEQLLLERALHGLLPTTEAAGALAMTASPGPAATAPASAPTPAVSPRSGIPEQIGGLLEAVNAVLPTGALDLPAPDAAKLSEFQIARLHLLSTAISSNQLTGQLLEAQEANLLYKYKEELELTSAEDWLILRTLLADRYAITPGWYWFRDLTSESISQILIDRVLLDSEKEVRIGALELARWNSVRPAVGEESEFFGHILSNESGVPQAEAIRYLTRIATPSDLPTISALISRMDPSSAPAVTWALVAAEARRDPTEAIRILMQAQNWPPEYLIEEIEPLIASATKESLEDGLQHPAEDVRLLVLRLLRRRGDLTRDRVRSLIEDTSTEIRRTALEVLIEQGEDVSPQQVRKIIKGPAGSTPLGLLVPRPDPEPLLLLVYRRIPLDKLEQAIAWMIPDGPIAYKAMALEHFDQAASRVRHDLDTNFQELIEESIRIIEALPQKARDTWTELLSSDINESIRARFVAAALNSLAIHGGPEDLARARRFVNEADERIPVEALKVIERFGDGSDLDALTAVVRGKKGEPREIALKAIRRLSPGLLREFLRSEDSELIVLALGLIENSSEEVRREVEPLLGSRSLQVREAALSYLVTHSEITEIEAALTRYLQRDGYYFNVVGWLDRVIHAPENLKQSFTERVEKHLL